MGSFYIGPGQGSLQDALATMPPVLRSFIKTGFSVLSEVPETKFETLVKVVMESLEYGSTTGERDLSYQMELPKERVRPLLAALGIVATLLASRADSPKDLVKELANINALDPANESSVLKFAQLILANRESLKKGMERRELVSEVFPSLEEIESTVDVRLRFDKGRVAESVSIALIHIDTDTEGEEVRFQASKKQLQKVVDDLQDLLNRMDEAEDLINKRSKEG